MATRLCGISLVLILATAVLGCDPPPTCATSMPARLTDVGTAPTNVFRMPIGANPTILGNSAAIISRQVNSGRYGGANTEVFCAFNGWSAPVFYTDSSNAKNVYIPLGMDGGPTYDGITQCGPMRWKSCISRGNSSDGPAWVVDTVDRCYTEFWGLNNQVLIADPEAAWAGALPLDDATQMWEPYEGVGGTAGCHLGLSSCIWPDETSTSFNHGFAMSSDVYLNNPSYSVWPSYHHDGQGTHADDLHTGMHVQLNPSYDISGLPTYKRNPAQAMKDYGIYVTDSSVGTWCVRGINPQGYTNNCWAGVLPSDLISNGQFFIVPIAQFRVLQYPFTITDQLPTVNNSCISYYPSPGTPPAISTISPTTGGNGTTVSLTGTNMSNPYSVRFGDTQATNVNAVSSTLVTCTAPAGSGTVKVSYRTTSGASNLKDFTYNAGPAPTLSSISPTSGTTSGGTACTLTGTNLTGCSTVSYGGTAATGISVVSSTQVRCTSPAKVAGTASVTATTPNGISNGVNYTYTASTPTLTAISPTLGGTAGGTAVTLTGTNFIGTTGVSFGGTAGTGIVVDSSTRVRCTSPAHATGSVSVTATTAGGTSNGVNYTYTTGGTPFTLYPSADSWVTTMSPGTNVGTASYMQVQYNTGANKHTYLKFDLSSVTGTTVISAKLSLYLQGIYPGVSTAVQAYSVSDDTWSETTITWNNKPAVVSLLANKTGILTAATRYEWDITSYVAGEFSGDKIVSINLQDNAQVNIQSSWSSREYAGTDQDPYLVVTSQ